MSKKSSFPAGKIVKFVVIVIGLGITGIIFGLIGALIGGKVLGGDSFEFGALGLALGGIIIGYPTGIIIGIISLKKMFHQPGSLLFGIIGSIIGAIITILLTVSLNLNANPFLLFGVFFFIVPIFCLSGFLSRK